MTTSPHLKEHWMRYKERYAAFASTTHFVERSVKLNNYCSNNGRSEVRTSQLTLCSNIVHDINEETIEDMITAKISKQQEYKKIDKLEARGKIRGHVTIKSTFESHASIEAAVESSADLETAYNMIKTSMSQTESSCSSFANQRHKRDFKKHTKSQMRQRKPNKIEREGGVHHTAIMMGQFRFHDVKNKDMKGIDAELTARDVDESIFKDMTVTMKRNELKKIIAAEKSIDDFTQIKFFDVKSSYPWSKN